MAEIPIIGGTGALGYGLAVRLLRAGCSIVIGSRKLERATEAAERLRDQVPGGEVEGLENAEAAQRGPIVFVCVPFRAQSETLTNLKGSAAGGAVARRLHRPARGGDLGAKRLAPSGCGRAPPRSRRRRWLRRGVTVVSALHTVSAPVLSGDAGLDEDVLICGNRRADKRRVAEVIELIEGLRAVDAGPLEAARIPESLTALLIGINGRYKTHAGIRVTGLPDTAPWDS